MNNEDLDNLLERGFAGEPPRQGLREQVLRQSLAAFAQRRHRRAEWRVAVLSAAAVVIAAVSFLLGRCSLPARSTEAMPVAREGQTVAVPGELVTWLEAARFFKQLGMPERVARAYERASALVPQDTVTAGGAAGSMFAGVGGGTEVLKKPASPMDTPGLHQSVENMNRMMAQSFGD